MSRSRAGRKSWETRIEYVAEVGGAARAIANAEWKYPSSTTKAMVIVRTAKATKKREVIAFAQAYAELSGWLHKSFDNVSDFGLSDMLAETFFQKAAIHTPKATYELWTKPETKMTETGETLMICLNERQQEFKSALERADKSKLSVIPATFEPDAFLVINQENGNEYKVILKAVGGKVLAGCAMKNGEACGDFKYRGRVCKHIGITLRDALCSILAKFAEPKREAK